MDSEDSEDSDFELDFVSQAGAKTQKYLNEKFSKPIFSSVASKKRVTKSPMMKATKHEQPTQNKPSNDDILVVSENIHPQSEIVVVRENIQPQNDILVVRENIQPHGEVVIVRENSKSKRQRLTSVESPRINSDIIAMNGDRPSTTPQIICEKSQKSAPSRTSKKAIPENSMLTVVVIGDNDNDTHTPQAAPINTAPTGRMTRSLAKKHKENVSIVEVTSSLNANTTEVIIIPSNVNPANLSPIVIRQALKPVNVKGGKRTAKTKKALNKLQGFNARQEQLAKLADKSFNNDIVDLENKIEEFSVKIQWRGQMLRFSVNDDTRIGELIDNFADSIKEKAEYISLLCNDKALQRLDTLKDQDISLTSILEARKAMKRVEDKSDVIELKLQTSDRKLFKMISAKITDKFQVVKDLYVAELKIKAPKAKKIVFKFDGDIINGEKTLQELDLEGGECIDVFN